MSALCMFLICLKVFQKCAAFNFDTNFIDIIKIGGDDNSYFGYSVLLQKGSTSSVLVGAPKANSTFLSHASLNEPGVLFKCDIGNNETCKSFVIDQEGNTEHKPGDSRFNYRNRKDKALLGAAMDGGDNVGDPVFVCAPRWVNDRYDKNGQHYLANGICYILNDATNLNAGGQKLMPLLNAGKQGYSLDVVKYYYALGQAGISAHYIKNGRDTELLLGAPGVLSWQGTAIRYKSLSANGSPPQQRLIEFREKRQIYNDANIPNPVYISSLNEENTYLGYALSSGRFHARYPDILWYVAGAPRAEQLYGAVLIFEYTFDDDSDLILHKKLIGHQLGSYFGASLLSVDVNGDAADDILVGAPTFLQDSWDEGCVYVYKNNGEGTFDSYTSLFGDKKAGSRFGTSMSNLGDINGDSFKDVAIAAPNEDEHGAVYIYLGSKNGLSSEPSQIISAKSIDLALKGFGFSISKGVDIDQNLSNDIAIGAYKSGHVVILKSKPVIKYIAKLESSKEELGVNTEAFNITYSISYTSSTQTVQHVDTKIQIVKDPRAFDKNTIEKTFILTRNSSFSDNVAVILKKSEIMDYSEPFTVELLYSITDIPLKEFCANCPVTDIMEPNSVTLKIPFANGCGSDNICQPDLRISANFENNIESLVIGSISNLNLYVSVENNGEPAYSSKILMTLPKNIEIRRISSKCALDANRLYQCLLGNVLETNRKKALIFELDIKDVDPSQTSIFLNLTVVSKGEEINLDDNSFVIDLPLKLSSDLDIASKSHPDQMVYINNDNKIKFDLANLTHEFVIQNLGPSPLLDYTVDFYIPIATNSKTTIKQLFEVFKPEIFINNQLMNCSTNANDEFSKTESSGKDVDINLEDLGTSTRRFKRSIAKQFENILNDLPTDRAFFINCTSDNFQCMQITCTSEEIFGRNQYIIANIPIKVHIDNLNNLLDTRDIILYSTTAEINKNNNLINANSAHTLLICSLLSKPVSYWIYIVCVITALIILAIIVFILYKLNFFNRPVREKLQNEYENSSTVREINDDDHDEDEESEENIDLRL